MLTKIFIEALLVDEELADQVLEAWFVEEIDGLAACSARRWMVASGTHKHLYWSTLKLWLLA